MSIHLITGTGTDVGKTIATAAIAALLKSQGYKVVVIKPIQTGLLAHEAGDLHTINKLTNGIDHTELARFTKPLSPEAAAREEQAQTIDVNYISEQIKPLIQTYDHILIEGAGGLLVRLNAKGQTFADIANALNAQIILVTQAGLGALNDVALNKHVLSDKKLTLTGLIIGSWPENPDLACLSNLYDFPKISDSKIIGVLPHDLAGLDSEDFLDQAKKSICHTLGGLFSTTEFLSNLAKKSDSRSLALLNNKQK